MLAGIARFYAPESPAGRKVAVAAKLQPHRMRGLESTGMIIAASLGPNDTPVLAGFQHGFLGDYRCPEHDGSTSDRWSGVPHEVDSRPQSIAKQNNKPAPPTLTRFSCVQPGVPWDEFHGDPGVVNE